MRTTRFVRCLLVLAALVAATGVWAADASPIVSLGDNTYHITVKAHHKFTRNTEKLKDQAMAAATQFCAKEGRQLKVVSVTADKSNYLVGDFAQTTLTFKALAPADPELVPAAMVPEKPAAAASPATEQLYADLIRLDELRKKGILNEAEFEAEKQKVLARSK